MTADHLASRIVKLAPERTVTRTFPSKVFSTSRSSIILAPCVQTVIQTIRTAGVAFLHSGPRSSRRHSRPHARGKNGTISSAQSPGGPGVSSASPRSPPSRRCSCDVSTRITFYLISRTPDRMDATSPARSFQRFLVIPAQQPPCRDPVPAGRTASSPNITKNCHVPSSNSPTYPHDVHITHMITMPRVHDAWFVAGKYRIPHLHRYYLPKNSAASPRPIENIRRSIPVQTFNLVVIRRAPDDLVDSLLGGPITCWPSPEASAPTLGRRQRASSARPCSRPRQYTSYAETYDRRR